MRKLIRYEHENKQQFIERVNTIMMDDFASEFTKTEDDKITISYLIFKYDLDDMVDIDYLFDWNTKEKIGNWYLIQCTVSHDDWVAWDKAKECEDAWIIMDRRQGIYNTITSDFIDGKECWNDFLLSKQLIRHILANEIKRINADLRRLNNWVNNSKDNGLKA
jgi:hypothetical protein